MHPPPVSTWDIVAHLVILVVPNRTEMPIVREVIGVTLIAMTVTSVIGTTATGTVIETRTVAMAETGATAEDPRPVAAEVADIALAAGARVTAEALPEEEEVVVVPAVAPATTKSPPPTVNPDGE